MKIDIDTSGSKPSLRFQGVSGTGYDLNLFNEKEMSGTATLTTGQAGTSSGDRTRHVNLEKKKK